MNRTFDSRHLRRLGNRKSIAVSCKYTTTCQSLYRLFYPTPYRGHPPKPDWGVSHTSSHFACSLNQIQSEIWVCVPPRWWHQSWDGTENSLHFQLLSFPTCSKVLRLSSWIPSIRWCLMLFEWKWMEKVMILSKIKLWEKLRFYLSFHNKERLLILAREKVSQFQRIFFQDKRRYVINTFPFMVKSCFTSA